MNNSSQLVWSWDGEPFGATPANGSVSPVTTFTYNLRFPGQYYDQETGYHQNRWREYDPKQGKYLQSDPLGLAAGVNTYAYVGSSPLMFIDPLGLIKWKGSVFSIASPVFRSATIDTYTLYSECVKGERAVVRVTAKALGAGVGFSLLGANVEFEDSYDYINEMALVGPYYKYAVGFSAGIGYGYSRILLGVAQSSGWGVEGGIDVSAGVVAGYTNLSSSTRISCSCK